MNNQLIGIGTYLKEDYEENLKLSIDRDNLDSTWKDWRKNKERAKKHLAKQGFKVVDIIVRPKELVDFCRARGLAINGDSRSQFVTHKTGELNK